MSTLRALLGTIVCGLLALAAQASRVRAETGSARSYALAWQRGPGAEACVSSEELAARLAQLAGPVLSASERADRVIAGVIARDPLTQRFTVVVRVLDRSGQRLGERSFSSEAMECAALTDSILLVTAILSDARNEQTASAQPAPRTPGPGSAPAALPPPTELVATDGLLRDAGSEHAMLERARRKRVPWELALLGSGALGVQPHAGPGLGALVRLSGTDALRLQASASYWFNSTVAIDHTNDSGVDPNETVEFQVLTTTFSACLPLLQLTAARVDSCFGAVIGARWLTSDPLSGLREAPKPLVGPALGLELRYALSLEWFLLAAAQANALFPQAQYNYRESLFDADRPVFHPSLVTGALTFGIGVSTR